jgi:hypothetical protein
VQFVLVDFGQFLVVNPQRPLLVAKLQVRHPGVRQRIVVLETLCQSITLDVHLAPVIELSKISIVVLV